MALTLVAAAKDGRLVICAGAGLSVADDASLPSGARLSETLHERLEQRLEGYNPPDNVRDVIAVADAAVVPAGGIEALQYEVLELADFEMATPFALRQQRVADPPVPPSHRHATPGPWLGPANPMALGLP